MCECLIPRSVLAVVTRCRSCTNPGSVSLAVSRKDAARVRQKANKIFHGPSDWLALQTSARTRRALNFWFLILWLVPGIGIWFFLKNEIWFLSFMSIYAIWVGHLSAVAAETPVEHE